MEMVTNMGMSHKISEMKKGVNIKNWTEMVRLCKDSGLSVAEWCNRNGINIKTYYYRLRKVRECLYDDVNEHEIVPVSSDIMELNKSDVFVSENSVLSDTIIKIRKNNCEIEVSENISENNLYKLMKVIKC